MRVRRGDSEVMGPVASAEGRASLYAAGLVPGHGPSLSHPTGVSFQGWNLWQNQDERQCSSQWQPGAVCRGQLWVRKMGLQTWDTCEQLPPPGHTIGWKFLSEDHQRPSPVPTSV